MTKDPQNPAQEVQEYTPEQAAQLIKAAADITGKPVTAFSVADAEAVLFGEIGYTRPPRPAEAARKELLQYVAERLKQPQESPENLTKPDIETIERRLAAVKMRMVAVRALYDDGQGIEQELAEITAQLDTLKREQSGEKAVLAAIEKYLDYAGTVADELTDRRTHRELDLPEVTEAQTAIKENPAILGFVPPEAFINHELRELAQSEDEETAIKAVNAIMNSTVGVLEKLAKMAQDVGRALEAFKERTDKAIEAITVFVNSPKFERLQAAFADFSQWIDPENPDIDTKLDLFWLQEFFDNFDELMPYIEAELERLHRERGVTDIPLGEFLQDTDPETGEPIKSLFQICVDRANEARAAKANATGFDLQMFSADLQPLPELDSKIPLRYVMANNPIANSLAGRPDPVTGALVPIINSGAFDLPVLKSGKKGEVTAYTMVTLEPESGVTMTGRPFTGYDSCVHNSVITLWEAGNDTITAEMVARAMANKTESEYISPQQQGAITKSLDKMRGIHVLANLSEEMQKRKVTINGEPVTDFVLDSYLLMMDKIKVTAGGVTKTAYHIVKEPVLLRYSKMTGQLLTVKADLMDIKKISKGAISAVSIANTETRQPIKEYLLRRIEVMKYARRQKHGNQSNRILFDTLYRETGNDGASKTERNRIRDYAYQVLEYWTAAGYITGYTIVTEGQKKRGIDITF